MIIKEVVESLRRRKLFSYLIALGLIIFFFVVTALFQNYTHIEGKRSEVESFQGLTSYPITDTLFEDSDWKEFLNEPNALERVRQFYRYLEGNLGEKYLHIHTQSIALSPGNVKWDEKLLHGYEDGYGDKAKVKESEDPYYAFKAVQMNKQAFDSFSIDVSEGEPLSSEDFHHSNNPGVIPVLLGSEYQSIYQVGDQLTAEYLFKDFQLEVKGFIPSNTFVSQPFVSEIYLDRYIVMPAQQFEAPTDEEEWDFQRKHYFNLTSGSIYSAEDKDVVVSKLEEIKAKSDFPHIEIIGIDMPLENLFAAIQEHTRWVMILAGVLFVGCILSISILMMTKIQDNYKNMSIHLISGATMNQLFRYVLAEVIVLVSIPALLMILLYMGAFYFVPPQYILFIVACVFMMTLLSILPIYLQFRKLPISRLLKRAE